MQKYYVLDTNVLLYDPNSIESFEDNIVVIPMTVLEELDNFKKYFDERGFSARSVSRKLDEYRKKGKLLEGVDLPNGGKLFIKFCETINIESKNISTDKNDNLILDLCYSLLVNNNKVILVTKDINLRIKADALGLQAEDYKTNSVNKNINFNGAYILLSDELFNKLYNTSYINLPDELISQLYLSNNKKFEFQLNDYHLIKNETNLKQSALVCCKEENEGRKIFKLLPDIKEIFNITPKDHKQSYLINALFDPDIDLIIAMGAPGAGKTLIPLACGLDMVLNNEYKKIVVSRPIIPLGKDPGALPGDILEKSTPWLQPVFDNLDFLLKNIKSGNKVNSKKDKIDITVDYLKTSKILEIQPLFTLRGRTIDDAIFIIDEAQNLTPHEVKTIISRAGNNTKIVLTGDIYQIDNPYLTPYDNGLVFASEKFSQSGYKHCTTIYMDKGHRSRLSNACTNIM